MKKILPFVMLLSAASCARHDVNCIVFNRSSGQITAVESNEYKVKAFLRFMRPHNRKFAYEHPALAINPGDSLVVNTEHKIGGGRIIGLDVLQNGKTLSHVEPSFLTNGSLRYVITVYDRQSSTVLKKKK